VECVEFSGLLTPWVQGSVQRLLSHDGCRYQKKEKRVTVHFTIFARKLAHRVRGQGMSLRATAKDMGCSHSGIDVFLRGKQSRVVKAE
jgi:hypothetical protein